ncbi:hypothetical protein LSAT2_031617, partial [Lamellibrachia satsuma]
MPATQCPTIGRPSRLCQFTDRPQIKQEGLNEDMALGCGINCEERGLDFNAAETLSLWRIRTCYGPIGVLGVCANAYIVWTSTGRRFPVRWETFRLNLLCSSVINLSLCTFFASILLWPLVFLQTGSDTTLTKQCTRFQLENVQFSGMILVASGVFVFIRQACLLFVTEDDVPLQLQQHNPRRLKLLRDIAILAVINFAFLMFLKRFMPIVDLPLCFVVGNMTSREIYLLLVPVVVVGVIFGVVVLARVSRPDSDCERPLSLTAVFDDLPSDKTKLAEPSISYEVHDAQAEMTHPQWKHLTM